MTPTISKEASVGKKHDVGLSGQSRNTIVLAIGTVVVIVAIILGVVLSKRDTSLSADVPAPSPPPTSSDIVAFIRSIALMGGDEFADPFSYQSQALANMKKMDSLNFSEEEMIQRYALACIFIATDAVETDAVAADADTADSGETDSGAGEGNRTLVFSLEGYGSTIELHPRLLLADRPATATAGLTSERQIPDALPAAAHPRPDSGRGYRLG